MRIGWIALAWIVVAFPMGADADVPRTSKSSPYVAPEGEALLVFVRPRKRLAEENIFSIVTERGECIGMLANDWKVVAPIRPGKQRFMVVTGVAQPQVQLLEVHAAADHTYVIKMRPRMNRKAPVELTVLKRSEQPLAAFPASILETGPFRPNLEECSAWVASRRARLTDKARAAAESWKSDAETRAAQTVRASDGWPAAEVAP